LRIRISRIDRRFSVQSDLNFSINQAFKDAKISVPFPQRDLHLVSFPEQQLQSVVPPAQKKDETGRTGAFPQPDNITRSHSEEVELAAGIDDVWAAITEVDAINQWLAKEGKFVANIGGRFALVLRDGSDLSGQIDIFLPPRRMRLVVSLRKSDDLLASGPTTIEFALFKREEKTLLRVSVSGIPATEEWEEDYRRSENRWKNSFVELQEFLARR